MTAPVVNIIVVIIIIIIIIIEHCYRPLLVSVVIYPALLRASHIQSHSQISVEDNIQNRSFFLVNVFSDSVPKWIR